MLPLHHSSARSPQPSGFCFRSYPSVLSNSSINDNSLESDPSKFHGRVWVIDVLFSHPATLPIVDESNPRR